MVWGQIAAAVAPSIVNGIFGGDDGPGFQTQLNDQLTAMRKMIPAELAAKVSAFKEQGIHPLYGLGIPFQNSFQGTVGGDNDRNNIADMGQNIGRAIHAVATKDERALAQVSAQQSVVRGDLENELLRSQIAQIRASINPAMSGSTLGHIIPGQADGAAIVVPSEAKGNRPGLMQEEAAGTPIFKRFPFGKSGDFGIYGLSEDASESAEGYGAIGGALYGAGALLGSSPLYVRDIKNYLRSQRNPIRRKLSQFIRK